MSEHVGNHRHDAAMPVAGKAVDPVCGMQVAVDSPHRYSFEGSEYRFCCKRCRERFEAEPEKYAHAGKTQEVGVVEPPGTIYICPMHPQIRQPTPGTCPICGMALEPEMPSLEEETNPELEDFTQRFWWTLPLSVLGVALAMGAHRFTPLAPQSMSWLELVLATPVVLWGGWPFFVRCVESIRTGNPNMWTLIGIGVAAAYVYSLLATIAPQLFPDAFRQGGRVSVYFEAASVIVSLTLLGQMLELRARAQTSARDPVAARIAAEDRTAYRARRWRGRHSADPRSHRRHPARASRRKGARRRRRDRRTVERRRIDADRRADAGREGRRCARHRRNDQRHGQSRHARREDRIADRSCADRANGCAGAAQPRTDATPRRPGRALFRARRAGGGDPHRPRLVARSGPSRAAHTPCSMQWRY